MNIWHDKYGTRHVDSDAAPVHKTMDGGVDGHAADKKHASTRKPSRCCLHRTGIDVCNHRPGPTQSQGSSAAGIKPGPSTLFNHARSA